MICGQTTDEPVVSNVPLSCVPPCRCFASSAATDRLWNWSVESPLFMLYRYDGTADSSCWQSVRPEPVRPRSVHCDEMSANSPLERISPPSVPKIAALVPGISTMACESGCWPFGATAFGWQQLPAGVGFVVASHVMSVNDAPASVERMNARPFVVNPYEPYEYDPPRYTVSGLPGGE